MDLLSEEIEVSCSLECTTPLERPSCKSPHSESPDARVEKDEEKALEVRRTQCPEGFGSSESDEEEGIVVENLGSTKDEKKNDPRSI